MRKMINLEKYNNYLFKEGKSQNTIDGYLGDIRLYLKWFEKTYFKECSVLLRENIIQYKKYLIEEKEDAAQTVNHKLSSLKKLNELLIKEGIQKDLVVEKNDYITIQESFLSPMKIRLDEITEFIQYVLEQNNERNYAIVVLFAYTGLRISELTDIELRDFSLETSELIVRNGKGEKQRMVIMNDKVIRALRSYLKIREKSKIASNSKYLFISQKSPKMHRSAVNRIFNKYPYDVTPHTLRHFFCTNALNKKMSLIEVKEFAGHTTLRTTQKYLHADRRSYKTKVNNL